MITTNIKDKIMRTIKIGDKMIDKFGYLVKVTGFDRDYVGATMVKVSRKATSQDVTPTANMFLKLLGKPRKAGDIINRAFYPENLE